jgi:cation transport ATPase
MDRICKNCGSQLATENYFCPNCGIKQPEYSSEEIETKEAHGQIQERRDTTEGDIDFQKINGKLKVKNSQQKAVVISLIVSLAGVILTYLTFTEGNPLYKAYAVTLISIFIVLAGLIVALILRSRAKKMKTLISGENVIASWQLSDQKKSEYASFLFQNEKEKNKAILLITTVLIVIIFGIVILFMGEGRGVTFLMMVALIAIIAAFALGMPAYYRNKNLNGDGVILIGRKFAYINGFFHNWDFPLSGIQKVKMIEKPFHGLYIKYYYFDRTLKNSEELNIPASPEIDLGHIVKQLKEK